MMGIPSRLASASSSAWVPLATTLTLRARSGLSRPSNFDRRSMIFKTVSMAL